MTTAKELYAKVTRDLDNATRERDSLTADLSDASSRISAAEARLHILAWELMPEAQEALPIMFEELSKAFRGAEESMASCDRHLQDAQSRADSLKREYERDRAYLGTSADEARSAMRRSGEYRFAENNAAAADTAIAANALRLDEAEKRLARFTELARQNFMHHMLLSSRHAGKDQHFLLSLWHAVGRGLRSTSWFQRMDADRAAAERSVQSGCEIRDKALIESADAKAAMQRLNSEFEADFQPLREALQNTSAQLDAAQKAAKAARASHASVNRHLADLRAGKVEPARAARTTLISILGREFGVATAEDLAMIKTLADRPAAASLVERAMECSEEIRIAVADRISIMEQRDAIQSTIDELEKVQRKMSRSGLHRSSKTIDRAETFMMSDMSDGFDLETLTTIAVVADAVSDMGSSSNSDWSSGSSWGSSSFD